MASPYHVDLGKCHSDTCAYICDDLARPEQRIRALAKICGHCRKPEADSKHYRYGADLNNPVKHQFEPTVELPAPQEESK